MIKLTVLIAGLTVSIFCGLMAFRSRPNNNNTVLRNNKDANFINDIKEIFGLPPISLGAKGTLRTGSHSSGGYSSSGGGGYGGGAYLPPNSFRIDTNSDGSAQNDSTSKPELTTPLFRIFIAATKPPDTNSSTTSTTPSSASKPPSSTTPSTTTPTEESLSEMEELTTLPSQSEPNPIDIGFHAEFDVMNFDIMGRGETSTNISISDNATPPQIAPPKIPIIPAPITTLQPPSSAEPDIDMTTLASDPENNMGNGSAPDSKERSSLTTPPTNLYLPPNKEYLPPKEQ